MGLQSESQLECSFSPICSFLIMVDLLSSVLRTRHRSLKSPAMSSILCDNAPHSRGHEVLDLNPFFRDRGLELVLYVSIISGRTDKYFGTSDPFEAGLSSQTSRSISYICIDTRSRLRPSDLLLSELADHRIARWISESPEGEEVLASWSVPDSP